MYQRTNFGLTNASWLVRSSRTSLQLKVEHDVWQPSFDQLLYANP